MDDQLRQNPSGKMLRVKTAVRHKSMLGAFGRGQLQLRCSPRWIVHIRFNRNQTEMSLRVKAETHLVGVIYSRG